MKPPEKVDYVIVGGGLQGCLLTHAIAATSPGRRSC
jgi:L-2-hydroxyglutarate oxidase LhgO